MERWALLQRTGPGKGRIFTLKRSEYLLGRGREAAIQVPDHQASRRHARIRVTPEGVELEDLGSANGTYIFGRRISKTILQPGDAFTVGQCLFYLFRSDERLDKNTELGVWILEGLLDLDPVSWRYRARQKVLDREVELEVLRSNFTQDSDLLQHYRHVLRSVAAASDPGIVPVFDWAEVDGRCLVARRVVTLRQVAWEDLPLRQKAELLQEFLQIIGRWYERGIGVPPALERFTIDSSGAALLRLPSPFDLYVIRRKLHLEYPQFLPYAAPEELLGESGSGKEESYRLGVLLYRALTGAFPRQAKTREDMLKACSMPIPDPKTKAPGLPAHAVDLLQKLLSRRIEARPTVPEACSNWKAEGFSSRPVLESRPRSAPGPRRPLQVHKKSSPALRLAKALGFLLLQAGIFLASSRIVYWLLSVRTASP